MRKWLQGKSRDMIAYEVHIGAGTVSSIIKEYKGGDFDADLLREVALNLKSRGLDIGSFAPLVRLKEVLEQKEWFEAIRPRQKEDDDDDNEIDQVIEKKMESLIMSLEVFCFKENLSVKQFFDCIHSMYLAAEKLEIPLEQIPVYIEELKIDIDTKLELVHQIELEKQNTLKEYHTTEENLKNSG